MSLIDPKLPKKYKNSKILYEKNLDDWRKPTEIALATVNLNLTQLIRDCFATGYEFDNDGNNNLSQSLQEQINLLAAGGTPITGTTSDNFTINTDGSSATLSTSALTANRTFTFPDVSGNFVITEGAQTVNGAKTFSNLSNPTITGVAGFADGTVGAPSITFTADTDTGIFRGGANWFSLVNGGSSSIDIYTGTVLINRVLAVQFGSEALPSITFSGDTDTGIYRVAANELGFSVAGANSFRASLNGIFIGVTGSAGAPSLRFNDTDTGFFLGAANTISASTGGTQRFHVNSTAFFLDSLPLIIDATQRAYYDSGGDTYDVESGANVLDRYTGGVLALRTTATTAVVHTESTFNTSATGDKFSISANTTTGQIFNISAASLTSGRAIVIDDANSLTGHGTGKGQLIHLYSNSADASVRRLMMINNANGAASQTTNLYLNNNGGGTNLSILNSGSSSGTSIDVSNTTNSGTAIDVFASNDSASDIPVVKINGGNSGAGNTIGIDFSSMSAGEYIFSVPADATDPTGGGGAATGRIAVKIGGATRYIPYY